MDHGTRPGAASISVVIPAFNAAEFIERTLASVSAQTREPLEVLVVDDASTDATADVVDATSARLLRLPHNRGVSAARNEGMRAARGEFVALLDADDTWLPHHLERVAGLLEDWPRAALAYSRAERYGLLSGPTRRTVEPGAPRDAFAVAATVNLAMPSAAVLRREAALAVGGFDEDYRYGEDFDFWLRLAVRYPVVCTDEITLEYWIHPGGKGQREADDREGQARSRLRVWRALDPDEDGDRREELSRIMLSRWDQHLRTAWQDGDTDMFDRMLALHELVPGSEERVAAWRRRRPLFPLRRVWNRLPGSVRSSIKRRLS